jgi:coproporphyrinogen III oxidase
MALPSFRIDFESFVYSLQDNIIAALEAEDDTSFRYDQWDRPGGGGGRSGIIEGGKVIEKGGVNVSAVHGELPESMRKHFGVQEAHFFATGVSLVIHPRNPMAPTVHANFRYFEMYEEDGSVKDAWFGGGADLTPYYLMQDDAVHFHQTLKQAADPHGAHLYPIFKEECDTYFRNTHRDEARGIGGLFFDYLRDGKEGLSLAQWHDFTRAVGQAFVPAYLPILQKRKELPYEAKHREWQEIRRGRYVEFNLIHDRGTHFGLKTNGRIESILMSLPPHVQWKYDHHPAPNSAEAELLDVLKTPRNWVAP